MNNILDFLQEDKENKLWIYEENIDIYKKYNQFYKEKEDVVINEIKQSDNIINKKKEDVVINEIKQSDNIINKKKEDVVINEIKQSDNIINKNNKNKENKQYPLDIILEYTNTDPIVKQNIKDMLIILIGKCNKIFGIKKTAEIMSGITKNSWNQSVVLFLSFFLDKTINYKEKNYLFNENKNTGTIIVK